MKQGHAFPRFYGVVLPSKTENTHKKMLEYLRWEVDKYNTILCVVFLAYRIIGSPWSVSSECGAWCCPFCPSRPGAVSKFVNGF